MSTIPAPAGVTAALQMIEDAMSYCETADFKAKPIKAQLEYFHQISAISRAFQAQALTEYVRRLWDGTVTWSHDRPMTGSTKARSAAVRGARKS